MWPQHMGRLLFFACCGAARRRCGRKPIELRAQPPLHQHSSRPTKSTTQSEQDLLVSILDAVLG